ncbi:hypothetical protein P7C70_g2422, partial [Phenoliferia sp. Uapishka_3]
MEPEAVSSCSYSIHFPPSSASQLPSLLIEISSFLSTLSSSYIFHNPPPFTLSLSPLSFSSSSTTPQYRFIQGTTNCTDAVDDEWFIVYLLREVTKVWEEAVVEVMDEDGQFLLIEGAEELPKWVTPDNAENRVFIYHSNLHLVPIEHTSALPFDSSSSSSDPSIESTGFIDRAQSLDLVRSSTIETTAPPALQSLVWARIDGYPGKAEEHHHKTIAYVPRDVALALADTPALAAEAIGAFYERDPDGLRACNKMTRFPPTSPSDAFVQQTESTPAPGTVKVLTTLTRPLYSQLVLQKFFSPKPFEKVGWMKGGNGTKLMEEEERRRSVGMKITCGFEILYTLTSPQLRVPTSTSTSSATTVDTSSSAYKAFLARLTKTGYFGDEIQGSKVWTEKENVAKEGWTKSSASSGSLNSSTLSFAQRVDEAITRRLLLPTSLQLPTQLFLQSPPLDASLVSSEDWLIVDEDGLEDMLRQKGPGAGGLGESDLEESSDEEESDGEEGGMDGVESGAGV